IRRQNGSEFWEIGDRLCRTECEGLELCRAKCIILFSRLLDASLDWLPFDRAHNGGRHDDLGAALEPIEKSALLVRERVRDESGRRSVFGAWLQRFRGPGGDKGIDIRWHQFSGYGRDCTQFFLGYTLLASVCSSPGRNNDCI